MRHGLKLAVAAGFVGAVTLAATAFGQTGTPTPGTQERKPNAGVQERKPAQERKAKAAAQRTECGKAGPRAARAARRLVHSSSKVAVKGGYAVVIVDLGTITAVDGSSVTIKRADGETVTATASDQTKVCRDGKRVEIGQLKTGDLAAITQVTKDGEHGVRAIRAHSPSADNQQQARPTSGEDLLDEHSA